MNNRVSRLVRHAAAVSLVAAFSACGSDNPTQTQESAAGSYTITSISQGGANCTVTANPGCTIQNTGNNTVILRGGTLQLAPNGTFTLNVTGTSQGTDGTVLGAAGNYVQTGSNVAFTVAASPATLVATFNASNNTLSVTIPALLVGATQGDLAATFTRQ